MTMVRRSGSVYDINTRPGGAATSVPWAISGFSSSVDVVVSMKWARIDWIDCRFSAVRANS